MKILISLFSIFLTNILSAQNNNSDYSTSISIKDSLKMTEIVGVFINNTLSPIEIEYLMDIKKIGKSGTSIHQQRGKLTSKPYLIIKLSKTLINMDESSSFIVNLKIYSSDTLLRSVEYRRNISD